MDGNLSCYDICASYTKDGRYFMCPESEKNIVHPRFKDQDCGCVQSNYQPVDVVVPPGETGWMTTITFLACQSCGKYQRVWIYEQWRTVESVLISHHTEKSGLAPVNKLIDHLVLFILSQVLYNQVDINTDLGQSPFTAHSSFDIAKILWVNGVAVGFYTVKPKGTWHIANVTYHYSMAMVDTVYIRKSYRGKGLGQLILLDVIASLPNQYIGFSDPLSVTFSKVLLKFLKENRKYRDFFWLCTADGEEGERENIWLRLMSAN